MSSVQERFEQNAPPPFRLDVQLHDLLKKSPAPRPELAPTSGEKFFPEPVFPQHPEVLAADDNYEENLTRSRAGKRRWTAPLVHRAMRG
jgi:hypothetical protein